MTKNELELAAIRVKIQRAARELREASPEKLWVLLETLHVESREGLTKLIDLKYESRR